MNTNIKPALSMGEFVPLVAFLISLVALSIDAMLPALPVIGRELGVVSVNDQQLVIGALFLGLGVAQMIYGPLSDSIGRKPTIYAGLVIFVIGCLVSIFSTNFEIMLAGRLLQGAGAAAPRIICIAMVRDQYEGRGMARIMSFVMGVFILVPAIAPALGQGILMYFDWRAIFVLFLVQALVAWVWFALRQPETLPKAKRAKFSFAVIWAGVKETCCSRVAFGYTVVSGIIFGAFVGYLSSAQQMFNEIYKVTDLFPLYFAILALAVGGASFVNARLVIKFGMRRLTGVALVCLTLGSTGFLPYVQSVSGVPELWINMTYFILVFLCIGFLFGNANALAMEPLGHIAGTGAAVVGSISTIISVILGSSIGLLFDNTVLPIVGGFACLGGVALFIMYLIERGRHFKPVV